MSTEPGAPEQSPLMFYQGQPISREGAAARLEALRADPEFQARIAEKDASAFSENTKLWRLANGMPADPQPPASPDEVRSQMQDRDLQLDDARLSTWEKHIRMNDTMRFEHRRGLVTQQQHEDAQRELQRLKGDREFCAKVLAGNVDAVDRWMRFGRIAAMQVAPDDHDWSK